MSESSQTIRVNFGKPMPVFPIAGVVLLPHAVLPLHIFEPRYRQMIEDAIDGSGQIAMAVFEGARWKQEYHGMPPIRPVVCVGQIVQHERLPDGRYNILLQGVCRARVVEEQAPDEDRLYRTATLRPLGQDENEEENGMLDVRQRLHDLLSEPPLTQLVAAEGVTKWLEKEEAPTSAVLELIGISVIADNDLKYRLLAEPDPELRAGIIERELLDLRTLLRKAERQVDPDAPKGVSWN
ncbi:MAG: LON peptidase substrate-binding domain-containing protein [Planctomycetota bacterium]|nr:LON peptidase substrate-binding domain-containing protein [Planctomycetota bacterium]